MSGVLEIADSQGTFRYHMMGNQPLTIGRGYDCDIILNDEYVSAHHLIIRLGEEGLFIVEDLNSENGTLAETVGEKPHPVTKETSFALGTRLHLGKTTITPHSSTTAVAKAKKLHRPNNGMRQTLRQYASILPISALLLLNGLFVHLGNETTHSTDKLVALTLGVMLGIVLWGGGWSFLSKLLTRQSHFLAHMGIFSGIACLFVVIDTLKKYVVFSLGSIDSHLFSSYHYIDYIEVFSYAVLISVLLATHLKYATHLTTPKRWIIASVLPVIGICSTLTINLMKDDSPSGHDIPESLMLPLYLRIADIKTDSSFINGLDELEKLALDEARKAKD